MEQYNEVSRKVRRFEWSGRENFAALALRRDTTSIINIETGKETRLCRQRYQSNCC